MCVSGRARADKANAARRAFVSSLTFFAAGEADPFAGGDAPPPAMAVVWAVLARWAGRLMVGGGVRDERARARERTREWRRAPNLDLSLHFPFFIISRASTAPDSNRTHTSFSPRLLLLFRLNFHPPLQACGLVRVV